MASHSSNILPALNGPIVTEIRLVDEITRPEAGSFEAVSLPGHLIHVVTKGEVEMEAGGVVERLKPGDSAWYWENEPVWGRIETAPWRFYTVNFAAPSLPPPLPGERVKPVSDRTVASMRDLLLVWRNTELPSLARHIRLHALLLDVILDLLSASATEHCAEAGTALWWQIEAALRADLSQPINLETLCGSSHRSERSVFRSCKKATGLSPMKRVKQVRLSYARGLLQLSQLSISEIAYEVGYERVQEFSRDYRKNFGCTPTQARRSGPDYRTARDRAS
jgi:AraC-like DNA-binding protein